MRRIGTQVPLAPEEISELKEQLNYWHRVASTDNKFVDRAKNEAAFYCLWAGQDASGVRKDKEGELAFPFDGASDQRVRWGEKIYNDLLSLIMISINSAEVEITCGGDADGLEKARALKALLSGVAASLGSKGTAEIMTMFHHMLVDSPAVGALDIEWRKRKTLGVATTTRDELQEEYAQAMSALGKPSDQAAIEFTAALQGEAEDEKILAVRQFLIATKGIPEEDVDEVIKGLVEDGEVEYRTIVDTSEGPELKALRYGEDFAIPSACDDFDYASPMFRGEWVTKSQLRERIASDGWDKDWVEEVIEKCAGTDNFEGTATADPEDTKELYNIVWCYVAETNERGETTRYVSVIANIDGSAFGKRIIRSRRGKWNIAFFRREVRNSNILDSRGLAELCAPAQGVGKIIRDMAANNAIVSSLPPVKAKGTRVRNVLLEPFAVINMGSSDDVAFMQPPAYPAAAKEQVAEIKAELLDFVGVSDGETDVTERRMAFTRWICDQWRDFLVLLLETAQDNASDTYLAAITGIGDTKALKRADISGRFMIHIKLDPRNLDNAKLIEKVTAASQILQSMDRKGTVDTDPFVRHFFTMLFPEMSSTALKSPEALAQDDIKDEEQNFIKITAGIMPQMDTDGKWNYEARLNFHRELQQNNPNAIAQMSPASQEIYTQWLKALEMQARQFGENAEIGRTGVSGIQAQ